MSIVLHLVINNNYIGSFMFITELIKGTYHVLDIMSCLAHSNIMCCKSVVTYLIFLVELRPGVHELRQTIYYMAAKFAAHIKMY